MAKIKHAPVALIIMDGCGLGGKLDKSNAVEAAKTPVLDGLMANYNTSHLQASGEFVGLPDGQMGNSEVGHTNIGAGRLVYQQLTRITRDIKNGDFFKNEVLVKIMQDAKANGGAVHLLGLVSPGGVHSHQGHLYALLEMAKQQASRTSTSTPSSTAAMCRRRAHSRTSRSSRQSARRLASARSRRSPAATTQWTATIAGTASRRPMRPSLMQRAS